MSDEPLLHESVNSEWDPARPFNPIFGRPPLIRLETLSSLQLRWIFAVFYASVALTLYFRLEDNRRFRCETICSPSSSGISRETRSGCLLDVPAAWGLSRPSPITPCVDFITNVTDDRSTENATWTADASRLDEWNRYLFLYLTVDRPEVKANLSGKDLGIEVRATLGSGRVVTSTDRVTMDCGDCTAKIATLQWVHAMKELEVTVTGAPAGTMEATQLEVVTGNDAFTILELTIRGVILLVVIILTVRLFIMLRLSDFRLWLPEHLWLLWVMVAMVLYIDPCWYWGLLREDLSSPMEIFEFIMRTNVHRFTMNVVRAFELVILSSILCADDEKQWVWGGRFFFPALLALIWLTVTTINDGVQLAAHGMEYGFQLSSANKDILDIFHSWDRIGWVEAWTKVLHWITEGLWLGSLIVLAVLTWRKLSRLPYLQTRYRQLTFRFCGFLYIFFVLAWIPPAAIRIHRSQSHRTPPTLPHNLGETIGNVTYSCLLVYVFTPITDYQHKLIHSNEFPDPSDRKWVESMEYNPTFLRFVRGDQSLFFFFSEEEKETFERNQLLAFDAFLAKKAAIATEHTSGLFPHVSVTEVKAAFHQASKDAMDKFRARAAEAREKVAKGAQKARAFPSTVASKSASAASSVRQGVLHPADTARGMSRRTTAVFSQMLEKVQANIAAGKAYMTPGHGSPQSPKATTPVHGLARSFHEALGLPVVVGMKGQGGSPVSPHPGRRRDSFPCSVGGETLSDAVHSPHGLMRSNTDGNLRSKLPLTESQEHRRSFGHGQGGRRHRRSKENEKHHLMQWATNIWDRLTSDVLGDDEPGVAEPLFCLETAQNLFHLSWEAYFRDPIKEIPEGDREMLERALLKRHKKREKDRRRRPTAGQSDEANSPELQRKPSAVRRILTTFSARNGSPRQSPETDFASLGHSPSSFGECKLGRSPPREKDAITSPSDNALLAQTAPPTLGRVALARSGKFKANLAPLVTDRDDECLSPPPEPPAPTCGPPKTPIPTRLFRGKRRMGLTRRNTFVNPEHCIMTSGVRRCGEGEEGEAERILLEVLEDKVFIDVEQYGWSLEKVVHRQQNQAILCKRGDQLAVAFRGTDNLANFKTDVSMWRTKIENWVDPWSRSVGKHIGKVADWLGLYQARVHKGFLSVWRDILKEDVMNGIARLVEESDEPIRRIFLTGHSLGGALASLAAWDIAKWVDDEFGVDDYGEPIIKLTMYSFGCPRVGNATFRRSFNRAVPDTFRVVNDGDVVCSTPPRFWLPLIGGLYKHAGKQVIIDWKGNFVVRPGFTERSLPKWHLRGSDPRKHQMTGTASDWASGGARGYRSALDAIFRYCKLEAQCFQTLLSCIQAELDADAEAARLQRRQSGWRMCGSSLSPGGRQMCMSPREVLESSIRRVSSVHDCSAAQRDSRKLLAVQAATAVAVAALLAALECMDQHCPLRQASASHSSLSLDRAVSSRKENGLDAPLLPPHPQPLLPHLVAHNPLSVKGGLLDTGGVRRTASSLLRPQHLPVHLQDEERSSPDSHYLLASPAPPSPHASTSVLSISPTVSPTRACDPPLASHDSPTSTPRLHGSSDWTSAVEGTTTSSNSVGLTSKHDEGTEERRGRGAYVQGPVEIRHLMAKHGIGAQSTTLPPVPRQPKLDRDINRSDIIKILERHGIGQPRQHVEL
eukprot:Sspe_Gene.5816::Locus_1938_Transcript_1_1_Confidence_1.000_Length_5391::g.5816::m.5816